MRVKKAEYVKDYKVKLLFSDGITKVVDFKHFLNSTRKLIAPLIKEDYFKSFFVDEITICWPNGLDFSPDVLYEIGKEIPTKKQQPKTKIRPIRKSTIGTTKKYK
jgi:hypothetical protein